MVQEVSILSYTNTNNYGDEIQSLAALHVLKKLGIKCSGFVDRDNPQAAPADQIKAPNLLINGFIPDNSVDMKAKGFNLIFSNLHIDSRDKNILAKRIDNLRQYQPIGCRDRWTTDLLNKAGVDAFFNYCLTLTFDRRKKEPINGKIFAVDIMKHANFPIAISRQKIHHIEHASFDGGSVTARMKHAQTLLDTYRDEAKLVITTRLHCALPCIAMGVPVILLGSHDPHRLGVAGEFIPLNNYSKILFNGSMDGHSIPHKIKKTLQHYVSTSLYYNHKINWNPQPLDIEDIKEQIISKVGEQIRKST